MTTSVPNRYWRGQQIHMIKHRQKHWRSRANFYNCFFMASSTMGEIPKVFFLPSTSYLIMSYRLPIWVLAGMRDLLAKGQGGLPMHPGEAALGPACSHTAWWWSVLVIGALMNTTLKQGAFLAEQRAGRGGCFGDNIPVPRCSAAAQSCFLSTCKHYITSRQRAR